jgi:hypothetical protein
MLGSKHIHWDTKPLDPQLCYQAYEDNVLASQHKSLELFSSKKVRAHSNLLEVTGIPIC